MSNDKVLDGGRFIMELLEQEVCLELKKPFETYIKKGQRVVFVTKKDPERLEIGIIVVLNGKKVISSHARHYYLKDLQLICVQPKISFIGAKNA